MNGKASNQAVEATGYRRLTADVGALQLKMKTSNILFFILLTCTSCTHISEIRIPDYAVIIETNSPIVSVNGRLTEHLQAGWVADYCGGPLHPHVILKKGERVPCQAVAYNYQGATYIGCLYRGSNMTSLDENIFLGHFGISATNKADRTTIYSVIVTVLSNNLYLSTVKIPDKQSVKVATRFVKEGILYKPVDWINGEEVQVTGTIHPSSRYSKYYIETKAPPHKILIKGDNVDSLPPNSRLWIRGTIQYLLIPKPKDYQYSPCSDILPTSICVLHVIEFKELSPNQSSEATPTPGAPQ